MASRKKTPAKKTATKKAAKKKTATKKTAAKKTATKKTATKKTAAKKTATKKPTAKKPTAKKPTAKKPTAKKPTAKKPTAKKPTAKTPATKKSAATTSVQGQPGAVTAHAITGALMAQTRTEGLRAESAIAAAVDDVAPCRLVDHGEGRFSLCFDDFRMPRLRAFDERGLAGNGYTWEAVVDALVRRRRPELVDHVGYDSETAMFVATGARTTLLAVAELVRLAIDDAAVLKAAIDAAAPDRLE